MQDGQEHRPGEEGAMLEESTATGNRTHVEEGPPPMEPVAGGADVAFRVTGASLVYRYLLIGIVTLVLAVLLYMTAPMFLSSKDVVVMVILGIWGLALLRYWVYLLDMPHRVHCRLDGSLEFVSLLRRRIVPVASICSIKVPTVHSGYLKFRTARKKNISMINHVDGLHELVGRIKRANPNLETRGC
jgi:hypothetical protein